MIVRKPARFRASLALLLALLVVSAFPSPVAKPSTERFVSHSPLGFSQEPSRVPNLAAPANPVSYDEQVGVTFAQNFSALEYNVTAVAFTDNSVGPGYLVNGLTDQDYWYQVGLSYNWPLQSGGYNAGFSMNYEVFDPNDVSIYPANGGGGIQVFVNGSVNPGDVVLLSLSFSSGNVVMSAFDWQTHAAGLKSYIAHSSNHLFIGLVSSLDNVSHFFTGLMTEQYHSSPYFEAGSPVTYSSTWLALTSAWMWMDEFDPYNGITIFQGNTTSALPLSKDLGNYFSSNGTAEIVSTHGLVTGLTPVTFPTATPSQAVPARIGYQVGVPITVSDAAQGGIVRLANLTISTSFGRYNSSSANPFTFDVGKTTYQPLINVPSGLDPGNYSLTIQIGSWQFLDSEAHEWISLTPMSFNETLTLTNNPVPPSNPGPSPPSSGNGPSPRTSSTRTPVTIAGIVGSLLVPGALGYAALAILAVMLLLRDNRKRQSMSNSFLSLCAGCGSELVQGVLTCPICGLVRQQQNPINDVPVGPRGSG